jgi:uncharacterized protein (UPF0261 family)
MGTSTAAIFAPSAARAVYVAGTFDTKGRELGHLGQRIADLGLRVVSVDLSTSSGHRSPATIPPEAVAASHPRGPSAVFTGDRGSAVAAMAEAFAEFIVGRTDLAGIVSAGGSGAAALVTPAMQRLPVGVPKLLVSTIASGDVRRYVGPTDICMMHSVADVSGINRISAAVLANAAHAISGMVGFATDQGIATKPAIGLSMFGVTTPCVQAVAAALEDDYDCIVFHATGIGGQSMEKLAASGLLVGVLDVTTTEIADLLMGGVLSAGETRLDAIIATGLPYVGSCGALDMVNFWAMETVPEHYRGRNLYVHNPQVTLMRTSPEENARMGAWIAAKLNRMRGPVRFLLPLGGVSLIDVPGQPFHDPIADAALFDAIRRDVRPAANRRVIEVEAAVNDPAFAAAVVDNFRDIAQEGRSD